MTTLLKIFVRLQKFVLRNLLLVLPAKITYRIRLRILYECDLLLASIKKSEALQVRLVLPLPLRFLPRSWLTVLASSARAVIHGSLWHNSQTKVTLEHIRHLKKVQSYIDRCVVAGDQFYDRAMMLLHTPDSHLINFKIPENE